MVKFVVGIPWSAGDFFGRGEIVEHVQFFGFGSDGLDGFDESTCF